jgi:DnaB helicase-like protein
MSTGSLEALTLSAIISEGAAGLRKLYAEGITHRDFPVYEEEFKWIERRLSLRKPLNRRVFTQKFSDFEYMVPDERLQDLARELKEQGAMMEMNALISTMAEGIEPDNALEMAVMARDRLSWITRAHSPRSDESLFGAWQEHYEEMRQGMILAKQGIPVGIPTGFRHIDHHFGGFVPGQQTLVLGRTGEGKSYVTINFGWTAKKMGYRAAMFCPELSKFEIRCRLHTLASADPDIQKACELPRSFRNMALMQKRGFNIKAYRRFCEYLASMPGELDLFTGINRAEQMSVGYIEDRVAEIGYDLVIVDPIYLLKPVRVYKDNPFATVGSIAEGLHRVSEEYNIPIVVTNQANRVGGAKDDAPHKDRSYNSDVPAQLADWVLGVKHISEEDRLIVRCTKARWGQEFRFDMRFKPNTGYLRDITPLEGNYFSNDKDEDFDEELQNALAIAAGVEPARDKEE